MYDRVFESIVFLAHDNSYQGILQKVMGIYLTCTMHAKVKKIGIVGVRLPLQME